METKKIIIGLMLVVGFLFLGACGGIGTETGNPEVTSDASTYPAFETYLYEKYGISFYYYENWSYEESVVEQSGEIDVIPADYNSLAIVNFTSSNGDNTSSVTVYVAELEEEIGDFYEFMASSGLGYFYEYEASYASGDKYEHSRPSTDDPYVREYYFGEGQTLIYIIEELFPENLEGEIIHRSIKFE